MLGIGSEADLMLGFLNLLRAVRNFKEVEGDIDVQKCLGSGSIPELTHALLFYQNSIKDLSNENVSMFSLSDLTLRSRGVILQHLVSLLACMLGDYRLSGAVEWNLTDREVSKIQSDIAPLSKLPTDLSMKDLQNENRKLKSDQE